MRSHMLGTATISNTAYTAPAYSATSGAKYIANIDADTSLSSQVRTANVTFPGPGGVSQSADKAFGWSNFTSRRYVIEPNKSNGKDIIFCHGMFGDASGSLQQGGGVWQLLRKCLVQGYTVWLCDQGWMSFGNALALSAVDGLYSLIQALRGGTPKVILASVSMGTCTTLNWARLNPSKVSAVVNISPFDDIESAHVSVDYTPSYAPITGVNAALYPSQYAAAPWHLDGAFLIDNKYSVPGTYSGTQYDQTAWAAIVAQAWLAASRNPSAWSALNIPILQIAATYDDTVPSQGTDWWAGVVNAAAVAGGHAAPVTVRSPKPTYPGLTGTPTIQLWAAGRGYSAGDIVVDPTAADGRPYKAKTTHTSTTGGAHPYPSTPNYTDWTHLASHEPSFWGALNDDYLTPTLLSDAARKAAGGVGTDEIAVWLAAQGV